MANLALVKTHNGYIPSSEKDQDIFKTHKLGQVIHADFKKMRNYKFHQKFFALLDLGFESWEPKQSVSKFGPVEKNPKQFRQDITIAAGFYEQHYRIDGSIITVAKSIKFSKMSEYEFNKLYSAAINVLLKRILNNYTDADEVDRVVDQILSFN